MGRKSEIVIERFFPEPGQEDEEALNKLAEFLIELAKRLKSQEMSKL